MIYPDALTELANAAIADNVVMTPGPWKVCSASDGKCPCKLLWSIPVDWTVVSVSNTGQNMREQGDCGTHADLHGIAAMRTREPQLAIAVLELLALQDEQRADIERLTEALRTVRDDLIRAGL